MSHRRQLPEHLARLGWRTQESDAPKAAHRETPPVDGASACPSPERTPKGTSHRSDGFRSGPAAYAVLGCLVLGGLCGGAALTLHRPAAPSTYGSGPSNDHLYQSPTEPSVPGADRGINPSYGVFLGGDGTSYTCFSYHPNEYDQTAIDSYNSECRDAPSFRRMQFGQAYDSTGSSTPAVDPPTPYPGVTVPDAGPTTIGTDTWGPMVRTQGRELAAGVTLTAGKSVKCPYLASQLWTFDPSNKTLVSQAQRALAPINYSPSNNGAWDERTKSQIQQFQETHGLPVNGLAGASFFNCFRLIAQVDGFSVPDDYPTGERGPQ